MSYQQRVGAKATSVSIAKSHTKTRTLKLCSTNVVYDSKMLGINAPYQKYQLIPWSTVTSLLTRKQHSVRLQLASKQISRLPDEIFRRV